MKHVKGNHLLKKSLPVVLTATMLTACVGQEGATNGEFAGVGLSGGAITAIGVVGGLVVAGAVLASDDDDDDGAVVSDTGDVDADGDTGGDAGGAPDGDADGGAGGDADGGAGGAPDGGAGGAPDGGAGGAPDGGAGGAPDGGTDTGAVLAPDGSFIGDFDADETIPASNSTGIGTSNLMFDGFTGTVSGCVTVPPGTTPVGSAQSAVTLLVGPPGANGFPGLELEPNNADQTEWCVPAMLSPAQINVIQWSLPAGNLYLAARNATFPNGELRTQITPEEIVSFTTSDSNPDGSFADGFALVNEATGDYAITWNTSDPTIVSAHLNDGAVNGASETVFLDLTQRPSNPARFFAFGNFNDPNDPLPNILMLLENGEAFLDADLANGERRFLGQLTPTQ